MAQPQLQETPDLHHHDNATSATYDARPVFLQMAPNDGQVFRGQERSTADFKRKIDSEQHVGYN